MGEPDYQINQLAQQAGVSVRTVRFYIDEGLLPPPPTRGRYAVYGDDYLERLELIRLLKERFLPLKEIRARLDGLSRSEVQAALREERRQARQTGASPSQAAQEPGSSALEYIDQLLSRRPYQMREDGTLYASPRHTARSAAPSPGQAWTRLPLAEGVELHIRQPADARTQARLEQLVEFARDLF